MMRRAALQLVLGYAAAAVATQYEPLSSWFTKRTADKPDVGSTDRLLGFGIQKLSRSGRKGTTTYRLMLALNPAKAKNVWGLFGSSVRGCARSCFYMHSHCQPRAKSRPQRCAPSTQAGTPLACPFQRRPFV